MHANLAPSQQWSLFSKTSHAMEDGKRLENLSWRLWNRETFCCAPELQARSSAPACSFSAQPPKATATHIPVPELSTSIESAASDDLDDAPTSSAYSTRLPKARPELRRNDSASSTSRGREKHITPIDLEKIVISIKETQQLEPIDLPLPTPCSRAAGPPATQLLHNSPPRRSPSQQSMQQPEAVATTRLDASQSTLDSSTSTANTDATDLTEVQSSLSSNTEMSANSHSIIRGFVPGGAPSSYRSQTHLASHAQPTPILKTSPQYQPHNPLPKKKKGPMFTIGTSSGEDESSLETRYKSSLSESLRRPLGSDSSNGSKKQTTFKEEVAIGRAAEHSPVFESDEEDDEVSESANEEDDDSSDWEDSDEASGPSSVNDNQLFARVDSRPNLTSRRSLLTTLMHEPDRAKALQNAASKSTPMLRRSRTSTPNGPSLATSPEPGARLALPGQEPTKARPIIMTTSNGLPQQIALSPRTTRRNMLSTELTESLRKNLLWERQHRSTGNLAALQRRHTAQDMTKLRQHPEPVAMSHGDHTKAFTNDYFHAGLQEYHAKGW